MRRLTRMCLVLVVLGASACIGEENKPRVVSWKQEVPLTDGRKIVIERISEQGPFLIGINSRPETGQELTFVHPDSGERVKWRLPSGLVPNMLNFDGAIAYYVLAAQTVGDYNKWECPNPPWIAYRYEHGTWRRVPIDAVPARFTASNLMATAKGFEHFTGDGYVTIGELQAYLLRIASEYRTISRERVNSNAYGCFPSVLEKLGRSNEITELSERRERK